MYTNRYEPADIKSAVCSKCGSNMMIHGRGKIVCRDCGHVLGNTFNKYGAKRTEFKGKMYDSKFEASIAEELETRKAAKDIKDYETQYRIEVPLYNVHGKLVHTVKHKVDFRIHHNDGSFELYEAKGVETSDYKWRRKFLEQAWLPEHLDHIYTVIKQKQRRK